jgi:hypothetical protein
MKRTLFSLFVALSIISGAFFPVAHAQVDTSDFTVSIIPEKPGPYESVQVSLVSYTLNLDTALISWAEDGKIKLSGIGKKNYSFTTKGTGVLSTVSVTIAAKDGTTSRREFTVNPAGVDILWQATDAIVPPLYRGKALPASEGGIKFVAIPNIKTGTSTYLAGTDAVYAWQRGNTPSQNQSGYGKNSFTVYANILNDTEEVSVDVRSTDAKVGATASRAVAIAEPVIRFYELSPLLGPLFGKAITDGFTVASSDIAILAVPYFISGPDTASQKLSYTWQLNNDSIAAPGTPNILSLHRDTKNAGSALISLAVSHLSKLYQSASNQVQLSLE